MSRQGFDAFGKDVKRLIYTAVFGGYDRVYPPVKPEPGVDYVIVTEDAAVQVPGWRTLRADINSFATPKAANLYHRALIHRMLPGYDASLYIDGNIRLLGPTSPLFEALKESGAALMLFAHPLRHTVSEELEAVIAAGKVADADRGRQEVESYLNNGFPDNIGLGETTIILKNHRHPKLDDAMSLWSELFQQHLSRDQLSLPYVVWKSNLDVAWIPGTFREPNPYFAVYPHANAVGVNPKYAHVSARSHDNGLYRLLLGAWHASWVLRRAVRQHKVANRK